MHSWATVSNYRLKIYLSKKKQSGAYIFTINNIEGLIKVATLINGFLRTPKINRFIELVDYINHKSVTTLNSGSEADQKLIALPLDISPLSSNA